MSIIQNGISELHLVAQVTVVAGRTCIDEETVRLLAEELMETQPHLASDAQSLTSDLLRKLCRGERITVRTIPVKLDMKQSHNVIMQGYYADPAKVGQRIPFKVTGNWLPGDGRKPSRIVTAVTKG